MDRAQLAAKRAGFGLLPGSGGTAGIDLELTADTPLPGDPCRECQPVREACPPRRCASTPVDARRCLSYPHRTPRRDPQSCAQSLARAYSVGDTCQSVCPFNQYVTTAAAAPAFISAFPDLIEESLTKRPGKRDTRVRLCCAQGSRAIAAIWQSPWQTRAVGAAQALQTALEEELPADLRETFLWALAQLS